MMPRMGELTETDFKKIIARRDARYDGRFLFGVKTTRIYCRILCPARPKPENILIFRSASEAERAGYRPCLRCHPDVAPGSSILNGTSNTVARALRIIEDGNEENLNVESLAEKLGVTDRHLRRLFHEHLGASPVEVMITNRLHLAKRFVTQTNRPVSEIAMAVGFQSIRRFNDAFKKSFTRTPSALRTIATPNRFSASAMTLSLSLRPPYDAKTVLAYLKRHEAFGIENVEGNVYTRFIPFKAQVGVVRVKPNARRNCLDVSLTDVPLTEIRGVLNGLRRLFDTDHNPLHLPTSKTLKPDGIRVPGSFDGFETAVSIILSQLVSTSQAKSTLKKLIMKLGDAHGIVDDYEVFSFPSPQTLRTANFDGIGLTKTKITAIQELAGAISDGHIKLGLAADLLETRKRLLEIRGIGPWTVELIAMRCLGDADAFPAGDLVVKRALDNETADAVAWSSSRAYLTHCLWRKETP